MIADDLRSLRLLGDFSDWHLLNDSLFLASSSDKLDGDLGGVFRSW